MLNNKRTTRGSLSEGGGAESGVLNTTNINQPRFRISDLKAFNSWIGLCFLVRPTDYNFTYVFWVIKSYILSQYTLI